MCSLLRDPVRYECEGESTNVTDEEWLQRVADVAEIEHAVGCPEGDDGGERAWRGWVGGMRTRGVSDSDVDMLVTGRRRRCSNGRAVACGSTSENGDSAWVGDA